MRDRTVVVDVAPMRVANLQGKRVLLVEDETLIAMMAQDMLEAVGATVVGPARSLAEALQQARDADIDAALLDVNLDGERVDSVAMLLKERGILVVLATGYDANAPDLPSGFPVIEKPYTEGRLLKALGG